MKKRFIICFLAIVFAFGLIGCGQIVDGPKYEWENYDPKEEFRPDEGIAIDGVLDEEIWSQTSWKTYSFSDSGNKSHINEDVELRVTSKFGEKGVYFAFDNSDPFLYYGSHRIDSYNSSIEFYLSNSEAKSRNDTVFEINLGANGHVRTYIHDNGGWVMFAGEGYQDQPFAAIALAEGTEMNTDKRGNGYTAEFYIPFSGMKCASNSPDYVMMSPCVIRTYNSEAAKDRLYYSFGNNGKPGYSSGNPQTWWKWTKDGALTSSITLSEGVTVKNDKVFEGDKLDVEVTVPAGKILDKLTYNGIDYTGIYEVNGDGSLKLDMIANATVNISATFRDAPAKKTVSGSITSSGAAISGGTEYRLYANVGNTVMPLSVSEDGRISGEVFAEKCELSLFGVGGLIARRFVDFSATDSISYDLGSLGVMYKFQPVASGVPSVQSNAYDGSILKITGGSKSVTVMRFKYSNENILKDGEINRNADEVKYNFNFGARITGYNGVSSPSFTIQILNWGSKTWKLKINGIEYSTYEGDMDVNNEFFDADDLRALLDGKLEIVMEKDNNVFTFYYGYDGEYHKVCSFTSENFNGYMMRRVQLETFDLTRLFVNPAVAPEECVVTLTGEHYEGTSDKDDVL